MDRDDQYNWIELAVRAGKLIGLNPVRTRWRLRAWQDRMRGRGAGVSAKAAAVTRRQKLCPACGAVNARDDRICSACGAKLRPYLLDVLARFLRQFDLGLTPETGIALALIAAFVITMLKSGAASILSGFSADLLRELGGNFFPLTTAGQWWRLWTCVFLHAGLWHIGFNAYALIYLMPQTREVYGTNKSLFVFFITGIGASLASLVWGKFTGSYGVSIGASGAISGLIGLMLVWGWRQGTAEGIQVRNLMARWVVYTLLFGFFVPRVDNAGHIGGWILGGILALVLPTHLRGGETTLWKTLGRLSALAILAAVLAIAYLAFTAGPLAGSN